jgi:hypothetical protein
MTEVEQRALRQIVKVVAEKGASYPSEISAFTDYDEKTVGKICRRLAEANYFERLRPKTTLSDQRLEDRGHVVNGGIQAMRSRDWYALNSDITWRMKVWDSDKVINEYGEVVDFILEDEEPEDRVENNFIREGVNHLEAKKLL